mmetsp:Transcript_47627/g.119920  ORF Transcript_47627/g.119920 Transcript_47627/m.119920 type:complete len:674 (-) Transcript_47627:46-2067(-)|eukprot:CAMPEP_0174233740 /NCGR_PEP_ID=MMETSP0417-20130205/3703_1 /TAXON_ID=242541 /ORGANISM="Mayorella sp, Strain BSH-02190019" /LENGTH=673 /DNA_ID=CAMNT_0015312005 /DNA_START=99 /DNA_END=2120 /DNA_ORIENTATION=+
MPNKRTPATAAKRKRATPHAGNGEASLAARSRKTKQKQPTTLSKKSKTEQQSTSQKKQGMSSELLDDAQTFASFMLDARLERGIQRLNWKHPTLVQAHGIPLALRGRDVLAKAQTGSGKTAAYLIPIVQKLLSAPEELNAEEVGESSAVAGIRALILVPTRDLCPQVAQTVKDLCYYCARHVRVLALGQSEPADEKIRLADFPEIVVATPGRAVLHLKAGNMSLKHSLHSFVIDEADLVLFHGYGNDVSYLVPLLNASCQNFLMSATLSDDVEKLREMVLHNPAVLKLEEEEDSTTQDLLSEFYYVIRREDKLLLLYTLLQLKLLKGKTLVFVHHIDTCFRIKLFLERFSMRSAVLNSELPHASRRHILEQFNQGVFNLLIATSEDDLLTMRIEAAASASSGDSSSKGKKSHPKKSRRDTDYGVGRGFDFRKLANVVNFDMPTSAEQYVHQVGRTARAGEAGTALTFVESENGEQALRLKQVRQLRTESNHEVRRYQMDEGVYETFRYRADDMSRSVTKALVKDARIRELKHEIVNSDKLRAQLEDNQAAADMMLRDHDSNLQRVKPMANLKEVPEYLVTEETTNAPDLSQSSIKPYFAERKKSSRLKLRKIRDPLKYLANSSSEKPHKSASAFHGIRGDTDIPIGKPAKEWRQKNLKVHRRKARRQAASARK